MTDKKSSLYISDSERKIAPYRKHNSGLKPDGTPDDNDRIETGPTALAFEEWSALGLTVPDIPKLRGYRIKRVREQMVEEGFSAALLFDPINIRYATDSLNMQVWVAHNLTRACFIPAEGAITLWDFGNCDHLSAHLPLVSEIRSNTAGFIHFAVAEAIGAVAEVFAQEIDELMRKYCGNDRRLSVDKMEIVGVRAFDKIGIDVVGGHQLMERARSIKDINELNAMRCSLASTEASMFAMKEKLRPGMTENELWANLHYENIRRGGEWIEARLLSSGQRTNPWYQECGPRVMQGGDLVAFDTDLIGPYGYCSDISRTWLCGDVKPTNEQKTLYRMAHEELMYNIELIRPGLGIQEWSEKSFRTPEKYREQRYGCISHGIGLCDEYPCVFPPGTWEGPLSDIEGELKPGMTVCVESYIGEVGGREGVKLEDQVLVTETGYEILSKFPFEKDFLD